jgi:hypothetical protein
VVGRLVAGGESSNETGEICGPQVSTKSSWGRWVLGSAASPYALFHLVCSTLAVLRVCSILRKLYISHNSVLTKTLCPQHLGIWHLSRKPKPYRPRKFVSPLRKQPLACGFDSCRLPASLSHGIINAGELPVAGKPFGCQMSTKRRSVNLLLY